MSICCVLGRGGDLCLQKVGDNGSDVKKKI
jgi:hypothetical protein